jgi:RNA polymerase sigma-70 factor (ECF subfamily)
MIAQGTARHTVAAYGRAPGPSGEANLLAAIRGGDRQAYADFVRAYYGRMLAVARRFMRCEDDAADAVQDAFLSLVRSVDSFQGQSTLSTWLHRIVVNACLMKLRSRKSRPTVSIDELLPQFAGDGHHARPVRDWTDGPMSQLGNEELRRAVRDGIAMLPDDYRTVLLLRDVEGLDTEQTAEILDTTHGNVKTRLHRARQALRGILEQQLASRAA